MKHSKKFKATAAVLAAVTVSLALISCNETENKETQSSNTLELVTDDNMLTVELPSYSYSKNDLSAYIALPSDLFTRDYKEGLELLGTPDGEAIEAQIKSNLKTLATERQAGENEAVEDTDKVVMDYVGKLDGVAFSGGTASDYSHNISLQSSTFIEGFDKGLIGMKAGETKDIEATFPDPYTNEPSLAGKTVIFTVTIDKITKYDIPELTDELVSENEEFFGEEIKTAEEYRASVKEELTESYKASDEEKIVEAVWNYAMENSEFKSYPEGLIEQYEEYFYAEEYNYAKQYGMTMEEYVADEGYLSVEDYKKDVISKNAKDYVNQCLVLYHACSIGNITVTEDEARAEAEKDFKANIEPYLELYSQYYGISDVDDYISYYGGIDALCENIMFVRLVYTLGGIELPNSEA